MSFPSDIQFEIQKELIPTKGKIFCDKCQTLVIKHTIKQHCRTAKHINGKIVNLTADMKEYKHKKSIIYYGAKKLYNSYLIGSVRTLYPITE